MAENIATEKSRGGKRCRKKSTRVDLTPMVDLGFLLITFFVFTTTLNLPKAMPMVSTHDKEGPQDPVCESCAITVIPSGNDSLSYYEGAPAHAVYHTTNYTPYGLRALLLKKKNEVAAIGSDAILIIKPGKRSTYKNLINIIDESNIAMYKRYYVDDEEETSDNR